MFRTTSNIAGVWTVTGTDTNLNQALTATWKTEGTGTTNLPANATDVWGNTLGGLLGDEPAFFISQSYRGIVEP